MHNTLSNHLICGRSYAKGLLSKAEKVVELLKSQCIVPSFCIISIGEDHVNSLYIRNKIRAAQKIGVMAKKIHLPSTVTQSAVLDLIAQCNQDEKIHGIIVQLPLPKHIDKLKLISSIAIDKDIDGFSLYNMGNLTTAGSDRSMIPCTPLACVGLIKSVVKDIRGYSVAMVGRSSIVGMPLSLLLNRYDCTVTLCHRYTKNLQAITRNAQIVITAIGINRYFGCDYFNSQSIVIDVGINFNEDGKTICGDVDFDNVAGKVKFITPVPGGVGPVTVAYLIINTIKSACITIDSNAYKDLYKN